MHMQQGYTRGVFSRPGDASNAKNWRSARRTSSKGRVSEMQLSHTSLTARSASSRDLQLGLAATERIARRRTQACDRVSCALS